MMRLMSLLALLMACLLAILGKDGYIAFLTAAFGGKAAQKVMEKPGITEKSLEVTSPEAPRL